jgi:Mg/Co/Ni transporter MgtE
MSREEQEVLQGVDDVTCMSSVETATARRVAREIKECARLEVQAYLLSDEFTNMVESLKRRERERMLQDISLQVARER